MPRLTLAHFVSQNSEKTLDQGVFELESERVLEVNLDGMIWMKAGAMIAYRGDIRFTREGLLDAGLGTALKKVVSGEGASLTRAEGRGKLYLADSGKRITVLELAGESIVVNGNDLLALGQGLSRDVKMMRRISAIASGGLFNVHVAGTGLVALGTHGQPLVLRVSSDSPVCTDPQATVAWSGNLEPELKTDMSLRTFLGRGSGESFQMHFKGDGFVVVQPYEERGHPPRA